MLSIEEGKYEGKGVKESSFLCQADRFAVLYWNYKLGLRETGTLF